MNKALAAIYLIAASVALATDLGGDGLGGPSLQPRAQSAQLGEPGIANRELSQVDPVLIEAGEPALDFRFAKNKSLVESTTNKSSLITFARSAAQSPGTYVGSDGLIKTAAVNLALYSEQFDNAAWIKNRLTISANQITAPDGKQTADKLVATSVSGAHYLRQAVAFSSDSTYSLYAKAGEYSKIMLFAGAPYKQYGFDLSSGTSFDVGAGLTPADAHSIEDVGNGWYRCSINLPSVSTDIQIYIVNDSGVFSFTGDDTSGVYLWGAQLEEGTTATPYIHTTSQALAAPRFDHDPVTGESLGLLVEEQRTNLALYSEQFDNGAWNKVGTTVQANQIASPDGKQTAESLIESTSSSTRHGMYFDFGTGAIAGVHTFSIFVKNLSGTRRVRLSIQTSAGATNFGFADFNLQTASVVQTGDSGTASGTTGAIEEHGNGWYRCSITTTAISGQYVTMNFVTTDSTPAGGDFGYQAYAADNTSGVYIWGAQLEQGTFPTSYIPTEGSAQTRYADVAAVQDEDFSTTNLLSYSESFDVGWTAFRLRPITANAITSPDGQTTADYIEQAAGQTTAGGVRQTKSVSGNNVFGIYAKANEKNWVRVFTGTGASAYVDLSDCSVGTTTGFAFISVQSVSGGWCKISAGFTHSGSVDLHAYLADADNSTTVTDSGGIYLWGASLTATEYPVEYVTTRNLLADSQDFERSGWTKISGVTVDNDVAQAPDGTNTADRLNFIADPLSRVENPVNLAAGTYVISVWMRMESGSRTVAIRPFSGVLLDVTVTTDWQRFEYSAYFSGGLTYPLVMNNISSAGSVLVWGAQLEPGTTATDYVRTVDVVGKDYGWYEPTEGTLLASGDLDADISYQGLASFNSSFNSFAALGYRTNGVSGSFGSIYVRNAGADQMSKDLTVSRDGFSVATAMAHNDGNFAADGTVAVVDTTITVPIFEWLQIGYKSGFQVRAGHIKRLTYWPRRQSDSTLQVITQ